MYTEWFAHTQAHTVYIAWPHAIRYFMTTVMLDECWSTLSSAHAIAVGADDGATYLDTRVKKQTNILST